jgi:AraC family transcriptional activator of tynA and feaB
VHIEVASSADDWAGAVGRCLVPLSISSHGGAFSGVMERRIVDADVALSAATASALSGERTERHVADSAAGDLLVFTTKLAGSAEVFQYGRSTRLVPGSGVLHVTTAPYRVVFPGRTTTLNLVFPRRRLALSDSALYQAAARAVGAECPAMRIYRNFLTSLFRESPALPASAASAMGETAVTLLAAALTDVTGETAGDPPQSSPAAMLVALRAHVAENLDDPGLSVSSLARQHKVSVRYVHNVFAEMGVSPACYIRQERLTRAARLLGSAPGLGVRDVGVRCGFTDATTFTRAFKRQYGLPPGSWRAEHADPGCRRR